MQRYIFILFVLLCISNLQAAELRSWTGSNSKTIEAEFVSYDKDNEIVVIKRVDGKEQRVKLSLFSDKDQDYVKNGGKETTDDPFGDAAVDNLTEKTKVPKLSPDNRDRDIAKAALKALNEQHVSGKTFDNKMGEQAFDNYIKALDPMKTYFLKSDVTAFRNGARTYPDKLKDGDLSAAFNIYNRYLQRINEAVDIVQEILEKPIDFNIDEEYVLDKDKLVFPQNADELKDRLRKKIKYEILQLKASQADNTTKNDPIERLRKRYNSFRKMQFQSTNDDVLKTFLTAIGGTFSPPSSYMSATESKEWSNMMNQKLEGIGAGLSIEDGITIITSLTLGAPAERSGKINVGDKIIGIGQGKDGEIEDVVDMRLNDVVKKIRGESGSIVRLEILDKDGKKKFVEITRDRIDYNGKNLESTTFEYGKRKDGKPYQIGVIRSMSFMPGTGIADEVKKTLSEFNQKKVDAVILDFSSNNGGSFPEMIKTAGYFIKTGTVVQSKGRNDINATAHNDTDPSIEWEKPLVILTSKNSSVVQITGALQDYRRSLIVGDSSNVSVGKMTNMLNLAKIIRGDDSSNDSQFGMIGVPIGLFYLPSGKPLDSKSVESDIVLPSLTALENAIDNVDPMEKIAPVREFPTFSFVTPEIIKTLSEKSTARIKKSKDFAELQKEIDQIKLSRERKSVPLNEKKYIEETKKYQSTDDKALSERRYSGSKIVKDFYLDEVLAITADYVNLLP